MKGLNLFAVGGFVATALGALEHRALPNSTHGYTPSYVDCPAQRPTVRSADALSANETSWLHKRRNETVTPMQDLLNRVNITGFDVDNWMKAYSNNVSALPNIGIAFSGGGWRALISGAGAMEAFDNRTPQATENGHLGGLLQASTYVAGLSGGSWLVGSVFVNNFTTITALRDQTSGSVYEFGNSVLEGPNMSFLPQVFDSADYYATIVADVTGKSSAGFDVSVTDIWARMLSYQLVNATDGGPSITWSSMADMANFENGSIPMPIVISDSRSPGQVLIPANTTIYEFTPFEFGTWDKTVFGFVPLQYLGTNFTNGSVPSGDQCVVGFDNAGYVMGTSSSLFNAILTSANTTDLPTAFKDLLNTITGKIGESDNDIAQYYPNPFYGYHSASNAASAPTELDLVDGGEDNENIPFHPLIQPVRHLDVIFAVDSSADNDHNWPNGSALVATYERSLGNLANGTKFPSIPDENTMINLGLNTHPTFFGCNTSNMTNGINIPLIVYIPNAPYSAMSNESTYTLSTNDTYRDAIILNGYNVATMGNATVNSTWPTCVGCAILSRSLEKTRTEVPAVCQKCFDDFCWTGELNSTQPDDYAPTFILKPDA